MLFKFRKSPASILQRPQNDMSFPEVQKKKLFLHKNVIIFLSISLNMMFWVLKRTISSFEYPKGLNNLT